jgi:hypothetical protein
VTTVQRAAPRQTIRILRSSEPVLGAYALLCIAARLVYPRILFPAPRIDRVPADVEARTHAEAGSRLLELRRGLGSPTRALYFPAAPGQRTVVLLHGNGETIFDELGVAEGLTRRGLGAMLVEYRGYGLTYGPPPDEASL